LDELSTEGEAMADGSSFGYLDRKHSIKMSEQSADSGEQTYCRLDTYDEGKRFDPSKSKAVLGHPKDGGVLITSLSFAEPENLGIDLGSPARKSEDRNEEEEFCKKIRRLGAQWWPDEGAWIDASTQDGDYKKYSTTVATTWPSNAKGEGVWVLKYIWKEWVRDAEKY
jgi:hypothetical protein